MKFSCIRENISWALSAAERFTGKNVSLPVLGNVLLEATSSRIIVSATNLEYALEVTVPGNVSREGKVSVSAKVVSSLIQSLKEDRVEFEGKQGNLLIKTESRDTRINGTSVDEFPLIPKIKKSFSFSIEALLLARGLLRVLPSVSPSELKPEFGGILFKVFSQKLVLAATDTFRLAEESMTFSTQHEGESTFFILPQRTAQELSRVIDDETEGVSIGVGENQVEFKTERGRVISRLVDGNFPEYAAIIPKDFTSSSFIKRQELLDAIRAGSIFASKLNEVVLHFKKNTLEVTSLNPEVGEHKTTLAIALSGQDVALSFNYRYLLDGLSVLEEEEIFCGVNNADSPALFRNKSDASFLYVLMPIRTQ